MRTVVGLAGSRSGLASANATTGYSKLWETASEGKGHPIFANEAFLMMLTICGCK